MSDMQNIDDVRAASRRLVRAFGFLHPTLAGTDFSPSAVHAIVEIGDAGTLTAFDLARVLGLEKSTISRLVARLAKAGLLAETRAPEDGRRKNLHLTPEGETLCGEINARARAQVRDALSRLSPDTSTRLADTIGCYADALEVSGATPSPATLTIQPGYAPGLLGDIATLHGRHYARHGLGAAFEAMVACGLAGFAPRLGNPGNGIWSLRDGGKVVGSIAIDAEDLENGAAHLRWFIVEPRFHGDGHGARLLETALDHCGQHGLSRIELWTFAGLDAARRLYERNGFALESEWDGNQWGVPLREQKFVREG